jgi:hypothetical protein
MAVVGWLDSAEVVDDWADAPEDATLVKLLGAAHELLVEYVGEAQLLDPPPVRYELAQLYMTQHLWARKQLGDGDTMGGEGFAFSTYPLVMEARGLMKPKTSPLDKLL